MCAFGQLIREPLLIRAGDAERASVADPAVAWRGPIERAIMAGDAETGVTVMRVEAGLDSGAVALAEPTPIEPSDDYGALSARLAELAAS